MFCMVSRRKLGWIERGAQLGAFSEAKRGAGEVGVYRDDVG